LSNLKPFFKAHDADLFMSMMVLIWGFHFVIMKDALGDIAPLTFNALRFSVGAPAILIIMLSNPDLRHVPRDEIVPLVLTSLFGPVLYQVLFASGLDRTTATNTALLLATMPTWTATISLVIGLAEVRRALLAGIMITLVGVALVVLSRAGADLSFAHDDLIGSGLVLAAAASLGASNIYRKLLVDRLGSLRAAVWTYLINVGALVLLASPELVTLSAADVPVGALPNVMYSGLLSGVGGFVFNNYALGKIGPTRTATYFNFNPIVAAFAGIVIVGEPFSAGLLAGGLLTLSGVMVVRGNMFRKQGAPALEPVRDSSPRRESSRIKTGQRHDVPE
jgi:drug/metabolite transporter (DMT)-like permease